MRSFSFDFLYNSFIQRKLFKYTTHAHSTLTFFCPYDVLCLNDSASKPNDLCFSLCVRCFTCLSSQFHLGHSSSSFLYSPLHPPFDCFRLKYFSDVIMHIANQFSCSQVVFLISNEFSFAIAPNLLRRRNCCTGNAKMSVFLRFALGIETSSLCKCISKRKINRYFNYFRIV